MSCLPDSSGSAPRVSIGVPVRNGDSYLHECLASLVGQTWRDLEIVISDNASSDATEAICREFAERDSRIRYVRQPHDVGAANNFNAVLELARGALFKWAAHDDVVAPTFVERCVAALDAAGDDTVLAFPRTMHIGDDGRPLGEHDDTAIPWSRTTEVGRLRQLLAAGTETLLTKCYPVFGLMRTAVLRGTGRIRGFNSSDKVLLVEMALRGDFVRIDERLLQRRMHGQSSRSANVTDEAVARWFDPARAGRFPMPRWNLLRGYADAVRRAPLDRRSKLACHGVVARWLCGDRNWRVVLGEFRIRGRQGLGVGPANVREPEAAPYLAQQGDGRSADHSGQVEERAADA